MVSIRSEQDMQDISEAGRILTEASSELINYIEPGMTTQDIDIFAEKLIKDKGGIPAFKGYRGFPASICISINEEVVHGIPGARQVELGDIVSVDMGVKHNGFFADMAFTLAMGKVNGRLKKLMDTTSEALDIGINQVKVDNHVSDISWAIQSYVESKGFSVVREFVGHGIGKELHEEPQIPNFGPPHQGSVLKEGMVLAIEPMVNMGSWEVEVQNNGWTAVTKDRLPSCHFEHTVAVTEEGPRVLTKS